MALVLLLPLVAVSVATTSPTPAAAAGGVIALVQVGPAAVVSGNSVTPAFSTASTSGDLLVATVLSGNNCVTFTPPAGWVQAGSVSSAGCTPKGTAAIFYYPGAPPTTSASFSQGVNGGIYARLSEYSGLDSASPLDQTGSVSVTTSTTSASVSTSGPTSFGSELAVTVWDPTASGFSSLSPGTGWTAAFDDNSNGAASDYRTGLLVGTTPNETEVAGHATTWLGLIATFKSACGGGALTVAAPPTVTLPGVTLNGYDTTTTTAVLLTLTDYTGAKAGWNITGTSTTLTASSHTLSTSATTVTLASAVAAAGNCTLPTNAVTYPVILPAGSSPPAAAELYNAAANSGAGPINVTLNVTVAVPAKAYAGGYSSTWTLSVNTGP